MSAFIRHVKLKQYSKLVNVIHYIKKKEKNMIMSINAEKVFNEIQHSFMIKKQSEKQE